MSLSWAASTLSWWREAGVDTIVGESPRDWLNPDPKPVRTGPAAAPTPALPSTLTDFQAWLLSSEDPPLAPLSSRRVGSCGDPQSGMMVLIDMPSAEDLAARMLLTGAAGELFDRMMAAIGRSRDTLYLASLAPHRTPAGSLDGKSSADFAILARHHVGLVRPKTLLLFGDACAKALLGDGVLAVRSTWHELETPSGPVRTLATFRPENLIKQPAQKKPAWEDLQMLKKELES